MLTGLTSQGRIERMGDLLDRAVLVAPFVREDGEAELLLALVAFRIGLDWRSEEREAHDVALYGIAVLAVVDDRHAISVFAHCFHSSADILYRAQATRG